MDHCVGSRFDAAVIAVDRLMAADRRILEAIGVLLGGKNLDILAQRALIAFEREDVIGLLVQDRRGDVALTAHRVDRHDGTLDRQHIEKFGMATISFDFSATLICPSTRRWRAAKAETISVETFLWIDQRHTYRPLNAFQRHPKLNQLSPKLLFPKTELNAS